jgi:hypothetical protein
VCFPQILMSTKSWCVHVSELRIQIFALLRATLPEACSRVHVTAFPVLGVLS